jgi:hypothetical protein
MNFRPFAGYHTLYEWYRSVENEHFPDPTGLKVRIEFWTFGLYPACIKYLMSAFDVPEVLPLFLFVASELRIKTGAHWHTRLPHIHTSHIPN